MKEKLIDLFIRLAQNLIDDGQIKTSENVQASRMCVNRILCGYGFAINPDANDSLYFHASKLWYPKSDADGTISLHKAPEEAILNGIENIFAIWIYGDKGSKALMFVDADRFQSFVADSKIQVRVYRGVVTNDTATTQERIGDGKKLLYGGCLAGLRTLFRSADLVDGEIPISEGVTEIRKHFFEKYQRDRWKKATNFLK